MTAVPTSRVSGATTVITTFFTTVGTITGLEPGVKYSVSVHASNLLGNGPPSLAVTGAVPTSSGIVQRWSSVRDFVSGIAPDARINATFELLSPQEDPSAEYNGQIDMDGKPYLHLVIHGNGAMLDANKTGSFFGATRAGSLTVYNLTMRNGLAGPPLSACSGGVLSSWHADLIAFYFCTFDSNEAELAGYDGSGSDGGVAFIGTMVLKAIFIGCLFLNNHAMGGGGALQFEGASDVLVHDSKFINNTAVSQHVCPLVCSPFHLLVNSHFYRNPARG
jgi:hypothetical protein